MNEEKLKQACENMIQYQLKARGISDKKVLKAMNEIPRENFISAGLSEGAYDDHPLPIGEEQTISQPYMVALMTELLELEGNEKVLEIGTGSGYQSAILSVLANMIYTVDRIPELVKKAKENLKRLEISNVFFLVGDGTLGWEKYAPYNRIIVTAASPEIPDPLVKQLDNNGLMVIPVGSMFSQTLQVIRKKNGKISIENSIGCVFVKLIGKYGWGNKKI